MSYEPKYQSINRFRRAHATATPQSKPRVVITGTPGQIAYENDLIATPNYLDGGKRPQWDQLTEIARWSWERNPTPRNCAACGEGAIKIGRDGRLQHLVNANGVPVWTDCGNPPARREEEEPLPGGRFGDGDYL